MKIGNSERSKSAQGERMVKGEEFQQGYNIFLILPGLVGTNAPVSELLKNTLFIFVNLVPSSHICLIIYY